MKTTILFDLDGTLIDSTEAILESFEAAYANFGQKVPQKEKILALIGHPLDFMFYHLGIPKERVGDYVDAYKAHYRVISKPKTTLLAGAKEAIALAATFARLGVVTTKTSRYSFELLEHLGVKSHFEVLIGREDVVYPKPHPEPIFKALGRMNALAEDAWMIGDTCLDIESAHAAGIRSVAVSTGYATIEHLQKCSLYIKESSLEAVEFIRNFNQ